MKKDIVLIRLDAIGDFILWTASAQHIRALFPHRHITLIANQDWAHLAACMPYFDDVVAVDVRRYSGIVAQFRAFFKDHLYFRRWQANTLIHPVFSRSLAANLISKWIKAPIKIAPVGDDLNLKRRLNKLPGLRYQDTLTWYTQIVPIGVGNMTLLSDAQFLSALGPLDIKPEMPNLKAVLPGLSVSQNITALPQTYYVIAPGAGDKKRAWGVDQFAKYIHELETHTPVVLCGSAAEKTISDKLCTLAPHHHIIDLTGKTTLTDLVYIISKAAHVLGNESGAIHMAAALGVPSTAILGGGHFGRFLPYDIGAPLPSYAPKAVYTEMPCYRCNWQCTFLRKGMTTWPCISNVSVSQVLDALAP